MRNVEYLTKHYVIEDYRYRNNFIFNDRTDYIINNCLYEIEYLYIVNMLNSDKFIIYDIEVLRSGFKIAYVRLIDKFEVITINIPPLNLIHEDKDYFINKNVYVWKTSDGRIIKKYSYYKLYNRNEHRYYEVGDVNSYGHKLIKIGNESVYDRTSKIIRYVGLYI